MKNLAFLRPEPAPPIVVSALGPKMGELGGRVADGICVAAGPRLTELVAVARQAGVLSGRDPERVLVIASPQSADATYSGLEDEWLRLARRAFILAP